MRLVERKQELDLATAQGKKVVLCVVGDTKSAQFRYRCKNVAGAVENGDEWKVVWFLRSELGVVTGYLGKVDLVVIGRQTDKDGAIGEFIDATHRAGTKILFDLDDLIFDYKDLLLLMWSTDSKNIFYWVGYIWGIRRIAKKVDGFLCTNDFLGQKIERSFRKPYRVIPNSLDRKQIEVSKRYLKTKDHSGFKIGYFSGSPTHVKDFRLVESEVIKFLEENDDVKLRVVGYMDFSKEMQKMINAKRVEVLRLVDYLKLQELIAEVDVNIAPLVINDFTNCKSELKFFEAAVVETITVASPTYTFKKAIKDGENGFLAQPGEWYDKLEYLYKHPEENRKIAVNAKKYVLKHYYGKEFLKEVENAYDYFAK